MALRGRELAADTRSLLTNIDLEDNISVGNFGRGFWDARNNFWGAATGPGRRSR